MRLNWAELCLNCRIPLLWYQGVTIVGRWQCKNDRAGTIDQYVKRAKGEKNIAACRHHLVGTKNTGRPKGGVFVVT